ncbi:MAG: glycosyltransferase [Anaerolineae bacterium]|nr:glycosyltransferase [Anaerolineae bacterium]
MNPEGRKRIAFFLPNLEGGGAERIYLVLANRLAETFNVDLVLIEVRGTYLSQLSDRVRVVPLGCGNEYRAFLPLYRYLRQNRPAAVFSTLDLSSLVLLMVRRWGRIPVKTVISLVNTVSDLERRPRWKKKLEKHLLRRWFPRADHLVALSDGIAEDYAGYARIKPGRITVIPNPLDLAAIRDGSARLPNHPWFVRYDLPVVLSTGRLTRQKNFPRLLSAFQLLRQQLPCRLVILGEGEERGALEAAAQQLGIAADVSLPGFVDNPFAYMGHADCFVLSSDYEGMPCALLEAIACGCPVVTTRFRGGAETLLEYGRYGMLVPLNDALALAQAMADVLHGKAPVVPPVWVQQFGAEAIAAQYQRLIED